MSKWIWNEGTGHTWTMAINPTAMDSIVKTRPITSEATTSGTGQVHFYEGLESSETWNFSGEVLEEDEYNELVFFYALKRRFLITLHRGQTYKVTMSSLKFTPKRAGDNFWRFGYEASCQLYGEV